MLSVTDMGKSYLDIEADADQLESFADSVDNFDDHVVPAAPATHQKKVNADSPRMSKSAKQSQKDKILTKMMTEGFTHDDAKKTRCWKVFADFFNWQSPTLHQIRPIADAFSRLHAKPFPREVQRRKLPLLLWCEKHIAELEEFLLDVYVVLDTGEILRHHRHTESV